MNPASPILPIITSTVIAATPLIYAAIGETVVEKAGVLNLGIEGMMFFANAPINAIAPPSCHIL